MKILAVHGYEIYQNGELGKLAKAACRKILVIQKEYSHIILLGGWHLQEAGPRPTIGEAMNGYLQKRGVPAIKLFTQFSAGLNQYMPPRDSMEEIDLLPAIFKKIFDCSPTCLRFDAICIWYFQPRLRFLYRNRNARCQRIIGVSPPSLHVRRIVEQIPAYLINRLDPEGKGKIIGKNRDERTFAIAGFREKNLPEAWET